MKNNPIESNDSSDSYPNNSFAPIPLEAIDIMNSPWLNPLKKYELLQPLVSQEILDDYFKEPDSTEKLPADNLTANIKIVNDAIKANSSSPNAPFLKQCRSCENLLLSDQFNKQSSAPDGLKYECRKCASARNKRLYQNKTPEEIAAYKKQVTDWQKENPEDFSAAQKRYRKNKKQSS